MSLWIAGMIEQDEQENQVFKVFALPTPPLYRVLLPVLLPGTRCYTDASTAPDSSMQVTRQAGLGIFIVTTQLQTSTAIYIKAKLTNCDYGGSCRCGTSCTDRLWTQYPEPVLPFGQPRAGVFLQRVRPHNSTTMGNQALHSELHKSYFYQ